MRCQHSYGLRSEQWPLCFFSRAASAAFLWCAALSWAQAPAPPDAQPAAPDPIAALASWLSLESYKATIKGLTQFGDRREGTDRNRAAIDWIEARLKSYGRTNTERIRYDYQLAHGAAVEELEARDAAMPRISRRPKGREVRAAAACALRIR